MVFQRSRNKIMFKLTKKEQEARKRICLALDVSDVKEALTLVDELSDYVGMFKIGKQLHIAAGNQSINIVQAIRDKGGEIFLDLKLHDTPNTVFQVSKECSVPGVCIFNNY